MSSMHAACQFDYALRPLNRQVPMAVSAMGGGLHFAALTFHIGGILMSRDHDLSHFCDLAEHGRMQGCSSGEYAAYLLALAAYQQYTVFDSAARRGFREWLDCIDQSPSDCRDQME